MTLQKSRRAFTLIEVIIAIGVLTIAVVAAIQLAISSTRLSNLLLQRFTAHHLAEEGLEIVRNMRDTNWLKNIDWRSNLADGSYAIEEKELANSVNADTKLHPLFALNPASGIEEAEKINPKGDLVFRRLIELSTPDSTQQIMHIRASVMYEYRGLAQEVSLESEITDWKKGPL